MKTRIQRLLLSCLALTMTLPAMARPVRFRLEQWKEAPASYVLETSNYRGSALVVKKRRTIGIAVDEKPGKTIVSFKPSKRQVVESSAPALMQPNELDDVVDEFLLNHPITMTFNSNNTIELNLQKNIENVDRFQKRYCEGLPPDSLIRNLKPDDLKAMIYMNSQMLIGLFINKLIYSNEFEEGRFTYRFPETEPIREAVFDLQSTLYGFTLQGEAFVLDTGGKPMTKNTYRFDFSPELNVLERMSMEVRLLEGDARDLFVLTR